MENYIDLINAYLDKTLSPTEVLEFENNLKTDTELATVYNEHLILLNGLNRTELKEEINGARQNYIRTKWYKYIGISIGIIIISILVYGLIIKSQKIETPITNENNAIEIINDSLNTNHIEVAQHNVDTIPEKKLSSETIEITSFKKDLIDNKDIKPNSITTFFNSVKKDPQKITVNTEDNFKITLKEGTEIAISKNAFIDEKTGKYVLGKVDLKVIEYYKLSDILLENLSTKSDDKLLETGGMLYVEARKNGSKLKLNPEKPMHIIFNNSGKKSMQLFEGEKNGETINWILKPELEELELKGRDEVEMEAELVAVSVTDVPFSIKEIPTYNGCEDLDKDCTMDKIRKFLSRKFNTDLISGSLRISVIVKVDKAGNVTEVITRNIDPVIEAETKRVLMALPQMKPAKKNGKAIATQLLFPVILSDGLDELIGRKRQSGTIIMNRKFGDVDNKYSLSSPKLGWINCDRFVNSKKKKIKYKVKIKNADRANVKMIFKSISSVLPSNRINDYYNFGEIPIDEDVILLAIKKKDDKIYLGLKELKTKAIEELDIGFKEVTVEELKAELIKLDKTFK